MNISFFEQKDIEALVALQPDSWSDLRATYQFYLNNSFCEPFKVTINNSIVGIGTAILHENVGWLSTIVTHSQFRKMGIGKAITKHLVETLQTKNCDYIYLIATALGEPVYIKVGFKVESHYFVVNNISLDNLRLSSFINVYSSQYRNQILELDASIIGENRSNHLESFLEESVLFIKNNIVEGVYYPTLGDGLIVAKTEEAGIELMKKRFQIWDSASFPIENLAAINFLKNQGFEPSGMVSRMYFGEKMNWAPQHLYNRVGGNIG
jgi:GNAT superfamily N-acetyltransferase